MRVTSAPNRQPVPPSSSDLPGDRSSPIANEQSGLPIPPLITHVGSDAPADGQGNVTSRSSSPSRSSMFFNKRATISSLFSLTGSNHHNDSSTSHSNDNSSRVGSPENLTTTPAATAAQDTPSPPAPAAATANAEPEVKLRDTSTNIAPSTNRLSSMISPRFRPPSTLVPSETRAAKTKSWARGRSATPAKRNTLDFSAVGGSGGGSSGLGAALGLGKKTRSKTPETSSSLRAWVAGPHNETQEPPRPYDYKPLIGGARVSQLSIPLVCSL